MEKNGNVANEVRDTIRSERIRDKLKTNRTVNDTQQYEYAGMDMRTSVPRIFFYSFGKARNRST